MQSREADKAENQRLTRADNVLEVKKFLKKYMEPCVYALASVQTAKLTSGLLQPRLLLVGGQETPQHVVERLVEGAYVKIKRTPMAVKVQRHPDSSSDSTRCFRFPIA
jgi:hypothetical protein